MHRGYKTSHSTRRNSEWPRGQTAVRKDKGRSSSIHLSVHFTRTRIRRKWQTKEKQVSICRSRICDKRKCSEGQKIICWRLNRSSSWKAEEPILLKSHSSSTLRCLQNTRNRKRARTHRATAQVRQQRPRSRQSSFRSIYRCTTISSRTRWAAIRQSWAQTPPTGDSIRSISLRIPSQINLMLNCRPVQTTLWRRKCSMISSTSFRRTLWRSSPWSDLLRWRIRARTRVGQLWRSNNLAMAPWPRRISETAFKHRLARSNCYKLQRRSWSLTRSRWCRTRLSKSRGSSSFTTISSSIINKTKPTIWWAHNPTKTLTSNWFRRVTSSKTCRICKINTTIATKNGSTTRKQAISSTSKSWTRNAGTRPQRPIRNRDDLLITRCNNCRRRSKALIRNRLRLANSASKPLSRTTKCTVSRRSTWTWTRTTSKRPSWRILCSSCCSRRRTRLSERSSKWRQHRRKGQTRSRIWSVLRISILGRSRRSKTSFWTAETRSGRPFASDSRWWTHLLSQHDHWAYSRSTRKSIHSAKARGH